MHTVNISAEELGKSISGKWKVHKVGVRRLARELGIDKNTVARFRRGLYPRRRTRALLAVCKYFSIADTRLAGSKSEGKGRRDSVKALVENLLDGTPETAMAVVALLESANTIAELRVANRQSRKDEKL